MEMVKSTPLIHNYGHKIKARKKSSSIDVKPPQAQQVDSSTYILFICWALYVQSNGFTRINRVRLIFFPDIIGNQFSSILIQINCPAYQTLVVTHKKKKYDYQFIVQLAHNRFHLYFYKDWNCEFTMKSDSIVNKM